MVQTQMSFKYPPKMQKVRGYRDVQNSVNLLFSILEEYSRLEKNLAEVKNQKSD